jgi:hypothetical protein
MTDTDTTAGQVQQGRWYPNKPPMLPDETPDAYTSRLTGGDRTGRSPYDHRRNRQCSIGWHNECSDPLGVSCECPCHDEQVNAEYRVDQWNQANPPGTRVRLPAAPDEPATTTTGLAYIGQHPGPGNPDDVAVVDLDGWPHPVALTWLEPAR